MSLLQPKNSVEVFNEPVDEWTVSIVETFVGYPGGNGITVAYGASKESAKKLAIKRLKRLIRELEK